MKVMLLAIGKLRGAYKELCDEYAKRLGLPFQMREFSGADQKAEGQALLKALPSQAFIVLLDERGKDLSSRELADKIQSWQEQGIRDLVFIIGGADGHSDEVRSRGDFLLGLGQKTWPHKLARVMLIEQLYRSQQINVGHPYHRD